MPGPADRPLRAWLLDAALVGLGVGAAFPPTLAGTLRVLDPGAAVPPLWRLAKLEGASVLSALVVALLAAVPAAVLVRLIWPRSRLAALALGPVLGGVGGTGMFTGVSWVMKPGHDVPTEALVWVGLAGALGVGPPWVAYLAVLARGRPGWPVALATTVWAMGAVVMAMLAAWARWELGIGRD